MTPETLYAAVGAVIFVMGLVGTLGRGHLFWKVLGFNFMGSGVFMMLIAGSPRLPDGAADPVPQAMVLTGIVVAVSATALALGMALRVATRTGVPYLSEDLASLDAARRREEARAALRSPRPRGGRGQEAAGDREVRSQ